MSSRNVVSSPCASAAATSFLAMHAKLGAVAPAARISSVQCSRSGSTANETPRSGIAICAAEKPDVAIASLYGFGSGQRFGSNVRGVCSSMSCPMVVGMGAASIPASGAIIGGTVLQANKATTASFLTASPDYIRTKP